MHKPFAALTLAAALVGCGPPLPPCPPICARPPSDPQTTCECVVFPTTTEQVCFPTAHPVTGYPVFDCEVE